MDANIKRFLSNALGVLIVLIITSVLILLAIGTVIASLEALSRLFGWTL